MKETMEKPSTKKLIRYLVIFAVTAAVMFGITVLTALIPKSAIRENALSSADRLSENWGTHSLIEGADGTKYSLTTDLMVLSVAWHQEPSDPLTTAMLSPIDKNLKSPEVRLVHNAIENDQPYSGQYLTLWHGSSALLRLLLTVMPIQGVYILCAVILVGLGAWLLVIFIRRRDFVGAGGLLFAAITGFYFSAPFSLAQFWPCALALGGSAAVLILTGKGSFAGLTPLFLLSGMLTAFFTEHRAELLCLLLPLLTALRAARNAEETPSELRTALCLCGAWAAGFFGMLALKWLLAAIILGDNTIPYVLEDLKTLVKENIGLNMSVPGRIGESLKRNLGCLFPFGWGKGGTVAAIVAFVIAAYQGYVYRKGRPDWKYLSALLLIALLPLIRLSLFSGEGYRYYFETYRTLSVTMAAAVFALESLTKPAKDRRKAAESR